MTNDPAKDVDLIYKAANFADGWLKLGDAPLGVPGLVWSPSTPTRSDLVGNVYAYGDGTREASSAMATGVNFTHWHALPAPPVVKEET